MNDQPIMLIEDNPDDRDLTIRALKKNNVLNPPQRRAPLTRSPRQDRAHPADQRETRARSKRPVAPGRPGGPEPGAGAAG